MQKDTEKRLPVSIHSRGPPPYSLDVGVEKKENEDTGDEELGKQEHFVNSSGGEKKEADGDVLMEDVIENPEECAGTSDLDLAMAGEKNQAEEKDVDTTGSELSCEKGGVKRKADGSDEWHFVPGSDGTDKSHLEHVMSYESSVAGSSDDEFSFGSEGDDDATGDDAVMIPPNQSMIKPFNMDLLRDCIARGEETLHQIEGKDVVFVVGKTGTGKSSFIQGIAGKTFEKSSYSCEGEESNKKASKVVFDVQDPIRGFEIGHAKSSMTKHISCYLRDGSADDDGIYYLDTPGFEDTNGEEIDIATSAMLGQVGKKCRSIRFVVMINYISLLEDRGGAMRAVLKFMRNFVDDFDANKRSFMFLFSHADEIKDVPESLGGAKKRLLNEIYLTMDRNGDASDVLAFIRTCLEKNYLFVDIFHPLKTDFSNIIKFIERRLKPIDIVQDEPGGNKNKCAVTSCTFTSSSKMRLMGAIRKQLCNLRILLGRSPVKINEAFEIRQMFQFFDKYIQFAEMRGAIVECEELISEHVNCLRKVLEEEVQKGTSMSFDTVFNESNIAHLKDALSQLQVIDSSTFDVQAECNRIARDLTKFKDILLIDINDRTNEAVYFYGFSQKLKKLKVWCTLDSNYKVLFDSVVDHTNAMVKQVAYYVCNFQMNFVCSSSTTSGVMEELTSALRVLKSIQENMRGLSCYLSEIPEASMTYDDFTNRLRNYVETFDGSLSSDSGTRAFDFGDNQCIDGITAKNRTLGLVSELIKNARLQDDLSAIVRSTKKSIESRAVNNYAKACDELEESCHHGLHGACGKLTILRDAMSILLHNEGSKWKEIEFLYKSQVDRMKSILKTKFCELDEMTQYAVQYGLANGERQGKTTILFGMYQWFDDFLPKEEHFVHKCFVKINDDLLRGFTEISGSINDMLPSSLFDTAISDYQQDFVKIATTLKDSLPEISEYSRFGLVVGNEELKDRTAQLFSKVKEYTSSRANCWRNNLDCWVQNTSNENNNLAILTDCTETLDFAFCEIAELNKISSEFCADHIKSISQPILTDIIATFSHFKEKVQLSLNDEMPYNELAALLARIKALEHFPNTSYLLPDLEEMKEKSRQRVSRDMKIIEDMIEQSADFDQIDMQIKKTEVTVLLDKFISSEASNRLSLLKRLLKGKETNVDEIVSKMIDTNNFSGLRQFLQPLAQSENQIRQTKFRKSVELIAESLKSTEDILRNEIDGQPMTPEKGSKIASCVKILEEIIQEAGDYLPPSPKTSSNIQCRLRGYKQQLNSRLSDLQERMNYAIDTADFMALAKQHDQTTVFTHQLGQYVTRDSNKTVERNLEKLSNLKKSIPSHVDHFIRSSFVKSGEIQKIFTGLKPTLIMDGPFYSDLSQLYLDNTKILTGRVKGVIQTLKDSTVDSLCYDDSIAVIQNFLRSLEKGMEGHLPEEVREESAMLLKIWIEKRQKQESDMQFDGVPIDLAIRGWAERLEKTAPSSNLWNSISKIFTWTGTSRTYGRLQKQLHDNIECKYALGHEALRRRDFVTVNETFHFLKLVVSAIENHAPAASKKLRNLEIAAVNSFRNLCIRLQDVIQTMNYLDFEILFSDFRGFVLNVSCLAYNHRALDAFKHTNQLFHEFFCEQISSLDQALNGIDFLTMKQQIEDTRIFGGFIADSYSLFHEELKECRHMHHDEWINKLKNIIFKHFKNGRDLKRIKLYALLGVVPSASKDEVNRVFKRKALICHPDKCKDQRQAKEWKEKFQRLQNARHELNEHSTLHEERLMQPFDDDIRDLGHRLRELTRRSLKEQHYNHVNNLLSNLFGIEVMENLVSPKLETEKIRDDVILLVKNHVKQVRIEVDSNWSERKYQNLNFNIKDLKMMEHELSCHPSVFPASWNNGVIEKVECEIKDLGKQATMLLTDKKVADANSDQFRRFFVKMGAVLVELPDFKDFTKEVMSNILNSCLNSDWGYCFLFKLGLSLHNESDTDNKDDARIAQHLLSEFRHFKEILTMVWNEETIQKPPEETVKRIRGLDTDSVEVDRDELLKQIAEFDSGYLSLLGKYLVPEADLKTLAHDTINYCESLKPISCDGGFGIETKNALPTILARVFALFTILKSGESFNRLEEDANSCAIDAQKLLMKPHNIQVLTLLCMFGCGTTKSASLKNQIMQVRTGEGKSMILGAAATILGLLGFRVRCVCYKDTIKRKGDIRHLTNSLLRGELSLANSGSDCNIVCNEIDSAVTDYSDEKKTELISRKRNKGCPEEILLIDEVDVFFGSDFYGHTFNPSTTLKEPEISMILKQIWDGHKEGRNRPNMDVIKAMSEYQSLIRKFPGYDDCFEKEVKRMLGDVRWFNYPPYHLDRGTDRIGYKEHDHGISYSWAYGYRTIFAYMKEADDGNLKHPDAMLSRVLGIRMPCGNFSYANINPKRILGVSGTLEAMHDYEKRVLQKYDISQYLYIPSVYESSNLSFDKGGDGVSIEKDVDDFFHKITKEITNVATTKKRAVIVFFKNTTWLKKYTSSAFYRKLGRKKEVLHEEMSTAERAFVIGKAATSGQVTICSSAFGRGTDFFSKDDELEENGGVHVVQAFFSADRSEEIQVQGRTARQGKQGSYKLILLDEDLTEDFKIQRGVTENWPKNERYERLCDARNQSLTKKYAAMEERLSVATKADKATHAYFDALLKSDVSLARKLFKKYYRKHEL